jgi:hypothetical protein
MTRPSPSLGELIGQATSRVCPVFGVTVYFKSELAALRPGVARALDAFLERAEKDLTWYYDFEMPRPRRIAPKMLRSALERFEQPLTPPQIFAWFLYAAKEMEDAPSVLFEGFCHPLPERRLNFLRACFPLEAYASNAASFVSDVLTLLSDLPVHYGYAGFMLSESINTGRRQANDAITQGVAMRFHGFEVDQPGATSITVRDTIKGVNWLTLLHEEFVGKLGGLDVLKAAFSEEILVHSRPGGVVIQAGAAPGLGDVHAGERLPLYREVARVLRPIRTEEHRPFGRRFHTKATMDWLNRFDD